MVFKKALTCLLGALIAVVSSSVPIVARAAKEYVPNYEPKNEFDPALVEQWKEAPVVTPQYPRDTDIVSVPRAPNDTLKPFVDARSVSRASDQVLRLTLVVESSSGVRNVFFDGIRCETRQYKTYAVGSPEKTLVPVKNPQWQDIPRLPNNAFRFNLYKYYACDDKSSALTPQEFLQRLKTDSVGSY